MEGTPLLTERRPRRRAVPLLVPVALGLLALASWRRSVDRSAPTSLTRGGDDDDAARARTMDEMGGSRTRVASARAPRRAETASAGPERRPRHRAFAAVPAPEVGDARVEPRGQDDGDAPPFPSAPTAGWAGQADARVAPRRPGEGRGCRPRRRRAPRDPDAFHHRPKVDGCSAGAAGRAAARGMPSTSTGTLHDDDLSWLTRVRRIVASSSRSGSAATCARR